MIARLVSFLFPLGAVIWRIDPSSRKLAARAFSSAFFGIFGEAAEQEADNRYLLEKAREKAEVRQASREVTLRADFPLFSPFCETYYQKDRAFLDSLFGYSGPTAKAKPFPSLSWPLPLQTRLDQLADLRRALEARR